MVSLFNSKRQIFLASTLAITLGLVACQPPADTGTDTGAGTDTTDTAAAGDAGSSDISGEIAIDGSSTVFPISEAMAEEFMLANPGVRITVGASGTGGGFEKFCAGETQISDASRYVKAEEIESCAEAGIEMVEIPVAVDALTVVANPENDWAQCMTIEELNTIWNPEAQGTIDNWNQVNPEYPDAPLVLFGPGTDSGTFDYFTEVVGGEEGASRGDFTASEDDNVLVQGVQGDTNALGYFGFAYFIENQDALKAIEIDGGEGCVAPSVENVENGTYTPMSRPLFIYVSVQAADSNPVVEEFVNFYLDPANRSIVEGTGYVGMSDAMYSEAQDRFANRVTGSTASAE